MTPSDHAGRDTDVALELLPFIPVTARAVLEAECGTGALGAAFQRRQPGVCWYGTEPDPKATAVAKQHLSGVLHGEIEDSPRPFGLAPGSMDVLVLGDRLRHWRDPAATLARLVPLLRDGGVVIAGFQEAPAPPLGTGAGMQGMLRGAGLTPIRTSPLQDTPNRYVMTAVRGAVPPQLQISQLVLAPKFMDVRTVEPGWLLDSLPGVEVRTYFQGIEVQVVRDPGAHILLLHRLMPESKDALLDSVARVIACGYLVVADWDDHPGLFPGQLRQKAESWIGPLLGACHAVQTSSGPLATILREINPEVGIHGNHLLELPPAGVRPEAPVKLFFGAVNRESDWAPCVESLNRVLADRPAVQLVVVHDRLLMDRARTSNKVFSPALPKDEYLAALHGCHVAWLPLADRVENRCKSDIKAVEAGAGALAILAAETVYAAGLRHGDTGWLYKDREGFESGLARLLDDAGLRHRLGIQARAWVASERMAAYHIEGRREWYLRLWARRAELTSALFGRVPGLQRRVQTLSASGSR